MLRLQNQKRCPQDIARLNIKQLAEIEIQKLRHIFYFSSLKPNILYYFLKLLFYAKLWSLASLRSKPYNALKASTGGPASLDGPREG